MNSPVENASIPEQQQQNSQPNSQSSIMISNPSNPSSTSNLPNESTLTLNQESEFNTSLPPVILSPSSKSKVAPKDRIITYIRTRWPFFRCRKDIYLLLMAIAYFILCTYIVCIANSYADRVNTNAFLSDDKKYIAPDEIQDSLYDDFMNAKWLPQDLPDLLVRLSVALILLRGLSLGSMSAVVLRRVLFVMGSTYLLRAPFVASTVLPSPWRDCVTQYRPNILYDALLLLLQTRLACGDVFFR